MYRKDQFVAYVLVGIALIAGQIRAQDAIATRKADERVSTP